MSVAHRTRGNPCIEQRLPSLDPARCEQMDLSLVDFIEDGADEGLSLAKVVLPIGADRPVSRIRCDRRRAFGPLVKGDQHLGQMVQPGPEVFPLLDQRRKPPLTGQAPHHYQMVDRLPIHREIDDAEVDIGSEASIELHLALAVCLACRSLPEVEKVELHRLAQLVDVPADKEDAPRRGSRRRQPAQESEEADPLHAPGHRACRAHGRARNPGRRLGDRCPRRRAAYSPDRPWRQERGARSSIDRRTSDVRSARFGGTGDDGAVCCVAPPDSSTLTNSPSPAVPTGNRVERPTSPHRRGNRPVPGSHLPLGPSPRTNGPSVLGGGGRG